MRSFLQIWSYLLKKPLMKIFFFYGVLEAFPKVFHEAFFEAFPEAHAEAFLQSIFRFPFSILPFPSQGFNYNLLLYLY